ncbi:MAG TPA: ferritin family protein [Patescibacteria group bacterium]|nr:ferritin family protein [Patescibacteria group bacterium]
MNQDNYYRLSDIFLMALRIEKNGYAFYFDLASTTLKSDLKKTFFLLAQEESEHIELFKKLYDECRQHVVESSTSAGINIFEIDRVANQHVFLRSSFEEIKSKLKTVDDILACALSFEEDTIQFFKQLLSKVDAGHQEILQALIAKEEEHKVTLQNMGKR